MIATTMTHGPGGNPCPLGWCCPPCQAGCPRLTASTLSEPRRYQSQGNLRLRYATPTLRLSCRDGTAWGLSLYYCRLALGLKLWDLSRSFRS